MAIEIIMKRAGQSLEPADKSALEEFEEITHGEELRVKITRLRNPKFHRYFFGLIGIVYDAQDQYATREGMLYAIKIAIGHCDEQIGFDGTVQFIPRSISWGKMDETAFREFYNRVLKVILEKILPNVDREDFEQHVYDYLKEPGPNQLR